MSTDNNSFTFAFSDNLELFVRIYDNFEKPGNFKNYEGSIYFTKYTRQYFKNIPKNVYQWCLETGSIGEGNYLGLVENKTGNISIRRYQPGMCCNQSVFQILIV